MSATIEIHRHREQPALPVATVSNVVAFSYMNSTEGSAGFRVSFKCSVGEMPWLVRVGDWLVLRDDTQRCIAWGHVDDVDGDVSAKGDGSVATGVTTASCSSWFDFLGQCKVYAPRGWAETRGTLYSLKDWLTLNQITMLEYCTGSIGVALAKMHPLLAKVRLPESLGGEFIGDCIPIVHDDDTAKRFAPKREVEQVGVANGLPSQFSWGFYEASLQELYVGTFVPDRDLIEMFPSLEDLEPTQYMGPRTQSTVPDTQDGSSKLATILGRQPCLIYRMRPWRPMPLIEAAIVNNNFVTDVDTIVNGAHLTAVNFSGLAAAGVAPTTIAELTTTYNAANAANTSASAVTGADQAQQVKYEQAQLLGEYDNGREPLFSRRTWDTTRAQLIPLEKLRRMSFGWRDSRRINCTSITLSTDPSTGIEAAVSLGMPITQDQSIEEHGLRLAKPSWPFIIPKKGDTKWIPYMRSVACQKMQFAQIGHTMSEGTLIVDWGDALNGTERWLPLYVGQLAAVQFPGAQLPFYCYVQQVEHSYAVNATGAESASTTVRYVRGLYGIEAVRTTGFPLGRAASPQPANKGGMAGSAPRAYTAPLAVVAPPRTIAEAGQGALARAIELWREGFINPWHDTHRDHTLLLINNVLRTELGLGFASLNGGEDYTHEQWVAANQEWPPGSVGDPNSNYCGGFAAHCWRSVGLQYDIRQVWWASTLRLMAYARNDVVWDTPSQRLLTAKYPQLGDDDDRKFLSLGRNSVASDVTAFGPQAGDILLLAEASAPGAISHIAMIASFDATSGYFETYEGNGDPGGYPGAYPDGSRVGVFGVVHRYRPVGVRTRQALYARAIVRPSIRDLVAP